MNSESQLMSDQHIGEEFFAAVAGALEHHPAGVSEYDLLTALRAEGYFSFMGPSPVPHHELFCAHFLLFHALYRLRDDAYRTQRARLDITPLKIRWQPYRAAEGGLVRPDPLRAYYLDLANLQATTARDVDELLASFWTRLQNRDRRAEALAQLGLTDPVDDAAIKQAYRRLVMEHHPDRGGDTANLQAINAALAVLL